MNKTHVIFENSGEIDLRAITIFGCSVKESTNPIGFFGTGLKYSLAVFLRLGHEVVVQCGSKQIEATVLAGEVRGKSFNFVHLDGQPCGFTTELGKNWEPWMAYRELYCNAKDEAGCSIFEAAEIPEPVAGKTRLIVCGNDCLRAHRNRREFLLEGSPTEILGDVEVYPGQSRGLFYKGVRVMEFQQPCLQTYNITSPLELTEDRTVKDVYKPGYEIAKAILAHADCEMLRNVLMAERENHEFYFDFYGWSGTAPGADFFKTVAELQQNNLTKVNTTALRLWREKGGGVFSPKRIKPTNVQFAMLEKALDFCEKIGYEVRGSYPIIIAESLGDQGVLAAADREGRQIFLTQMLFNQDGTKGVARALIEEYLHLQFNYADCSREMQNHVFSKMVSLGEEMIGEPL